MNHFKSLYQVIESKYAHNFPQHAQSQNFAHQLLTEPQQVTAKASLRKNLGNQLQMSSGDKTTKAQNSSVKQGSNMNVNNLLGDLKTPDKCGNGFNSVVSGDKTNDKFSYEKFQIMNSNSIEKFRNQKNTAQNIKGGTQPSKAQGMVFSDNKRQSVNAHSFKKINFKNQMNNNLSDDKQLTVSQPFFQNVTHADPRTAGNANISDNKVNSITSPSANVNETETEQEVPPFKPMIIKSNSQALGGGIESNTTTKKSPKGADLKKINAMKEAINQVNIQAKLPSSTTNKSTTAMKLHINNSLKNEEVPNKAASKDLFSNRGGASSYGALSVGNGPIKINQKIKMAINSN